MLLQENSIMTKAEELLRKEITLFEWGEDNDKQLIPYEDALIAVNKALSISSVVWQSEQLCERLHSTDFNGKCFKCG
jgi:hypothetical protein